MASAPADADDRTRRFVEGMTAEERMLVVLNRELYDGTWDEMVADLKARLEGRPYIFKLAYRIADDLERIERLREFETSATMLGWSRRPRRQAPPGRGSDSAGGRRCGVLLLCAQGALAPRRPR